MSNKDSSSIIPAIFLAVILLGGFIVVATVDLVQCPTCRGYPLLQYLCPLCGHDGRVTILQYVVHQIGG